MSKKLVAATLILACVTAVLIYVYLGFVKPAKPAIITSTNSASTAPPEASLSFIPSLITSSSGQTSYVNVAIETNSHPSLIQLEIAYDPRILFDVKILPGSYFVNPIVVFEKIDIKNGRISYALSGDSINANQKTVATLSFPAPLLLGNSETYLSFLPKTSAKEKTKNIKITNMTNAGIIIQQPILAPIASPSGIKSL